MYKKWISRLEEVTLRPLHLYCRQLGLLFQTRLSLFA